MNKLESPKLENIGKDCLYWDTGCKFPKAELNGRMSCEGVIDDVYIFLKDAIRPLSLNSNQIKDLNSSVPTPQRARSLPPGDIKV